VRGTVTFGDPGTGPATFRQAVITLRPPGATHAGGPYDNLAPALGPTTLPPGGSVPLGATFTLPASGPAGQWEAYATYQDLQGAYADGPSVYFTVSASSTSTVTSSSGSGSTGSSGSGSTGSTTGSTGTTASSAPFTVVGNKIVDSLGRTHLFHGVARPSLEWDPAGNSLSLSDYQLMANDWRANTVRISLNQDYWLTGAGLYSPTYRATIAQSVAWAEQAGMDVILDLHWTDEGDLQLASNNQGQKPMADVNSIQFWSEVADVYKNDPHVLFELFNEPFDISWDVWLNGGATGGTSSFTAAGMQSLYNAVRATGANNLVVIGGLSWSADLTGVPTHRVVGNNIVYNTHIYDYPGTQKPTWDGLFGFLTATDPVIATEFGQYDCGTQFVTDFIGYADAHGMGWTSWAWFPRGCAFPSIIADWSGAPSAMGGPVKAALTSY
jgi:endoglucanase